MQPSNFVNCDWEKNTKQWIGKESCCKNYLLKKKTKKMTPENDLSKSIQTILKSLKEQQKPEQEPDWIEGVSSQFCKLKQWIINSAI